MLCCMLQSTRIIFICMKCANILSRIFLTQTRNPNSLPQPIKVYWIDENTGEKVFNAQLEKGERHTNFISTFIGHKFVFEDAVTGEPLEELVVPSHGIIGIGNHVQPHVPREGVPEEVYDTLRNEWKRHKMIKRTFSPLAFDKGRLPDDLYASLG